MTMKFSGISSQPTPVPFKNRGKFIPIAKLPETKATDPALSTTPVATKNIVLKPKQIAIMPPSTDLPPRDSPSLYEAKTRPIKHAPIIEPEPYETNPGGPTKPESPVCFAPEQA